MTVIHVGVDSWIIQDGNYPDFDGQKLRTRRAGDRSFVLVPRTDAWEDDGGNAHYVLECELKPAVVKYSQ